MKSTHQEIAQIIGTNGIVVCRDHPQLGAAIAHLSRTRRLTKVLPGVYTDPSEIAVPEVRIAALVASAPNAVLVGAAAARISYWPEVEVPVVSAALPHFRADIRGYTFSQRVIPTELIRCRRSIRFTAPALTTWDLTSTEGTETIDEVLRRRAATLDQLRHALDLTRCRRGNTERHRHLLDSRDEPWSAAERVLHRILREGGYRRWQANFEISLKGRTCYLDVAFPGLKVVIEVDGRWVHSDRATFESDRDRQNLLVAAGWRVVRLTWAMLAHPDQVLAILTDVIGRA